MQAHKATSASRHFPCWKNGDIVAPEQAQVSIYDHGLLYGDGCFEGLRFYHRQPFRLERHLTRLSASLTALAITMPYSNEQLMTAVNQTIEQSGLDDGYLRILVTRGEGDMGLNPRHCLWTNVFIIPAMLTMVSEQQRQAGVNLVTSSIKRAVGTGLDARVKSLNYLHSILARMEANAAGADEAILLNQSGYVAECSAENIFIVKGDSLLTPPINDGALAGITREVLLSLAPSHGLNCREQSLTSYDLYNADESFICGSGARVIPVRMIDGRQLGQCPGTVYKKLSLAYQALIDSECGDRL